MHDRSDKAFDRLLRDKFSNFSETPSPAVWEQLSRSLDQSPKKRFPYAWLSAAAVLIFAAIGLWLNSPSPIQENQPSVNAGVQMPEPKSPNANLPTDQESNVRSHSVKVEPVITRETKNTPPHFQLAVQPKTDLPVIETVLNTPELVVREDSSPKTADASPQLNAAIAPNTSEMPAEEFPESPSQRGGSLGRLVNKLVAKIDSREDKLIEVSEDAGEGLRITGLNFGLVKMKNRNTK